MGGGEVVAWRGQWWCTGVRAKQEGDDSEIHSERKEEDREKGRVMAVRCGASRRRRMSRSGEGVARTGQLHIRGSRCVSRRRRGSGAKDRECREEERAQQEAHSHLSRPRRPQMIDGPERTFLCLKF